MFYNIQKALLNFTKDKTAKAKKSADLDLQYGKINKDERDKQIATADDEPYVKVLQVEFDQKQPNIQPSLLVPPVHWCHPKWFVTQKKKVESLLLEFQ